MMMCMRTLGAFQRIKDREKIYDLETFEKISSLASASKEVAVEVAEGVIKLFNADEILFYFDNSSEEQKLSATTYGKVIEIPASALEDKESKFTDGIAFFVATGLLRRISETKYMVNERVLADLNKLYCPSQGLEEEPSKAFTKTHK